MFVFIITVTLCSVSAFSGSDNNTYDSDTKATKEKFITITSPESGKSETTYNKSYSICGVTEFEKIRVELYRYNDEKKQYDRIVIDEKSYWDIGQSGFFAKEIDLKEGDNKIMLVAYKLSDYNDQQRSIFEIKRVDKGFLDKIKDSILNIKSLFS